ncbi:HNH endonuclease [Pseudomonas syringae]|nr:HNH endonuclease [Pseudomonas syringae]
MRYWWVNHKKTSKFEIAGGFLWSPMQKADGARNHFYDNMRVASPGDAVISFSHAQICHVGLVADFAIPTPKPPSFGTTGENWDKNNGWLLPINWKRLDRPVIPKDRISEFGNLLPAKYSPIDPLSGRGRENAYLASIDKEIFDTLIGFSDFSLISDIAFEGVKVLDSIDDAIEKEVLTDKSIDSTVKRQVVEGRRGQGKFKINIYKFEKVCRLTSIATPNLLIASHVKPWRLCSTASERIDGANGLLLTPHVDYLFDRGLISFSSDGKVLVSPRLDSFDLQRLGLLDACAAPGRKLHSEQEVYMSFHRKNIFLS